MLRDAKLPGERNLQSASICTPRRFSCTAHRLTVLLWGLSSSAWLLLISYVGSRTTSTALACFPPVQFLVVVVASRIVSLCGAQRDESARSFLLGSGWGDETLSRIGVLVGVAAVGETVSVGQLELGLAVALQTLLAPLVLLLSPYFDLAWPSFASPVGIAIAACTSGAIAILNLLFHSPLRFALFPPPSFLLLLALAGALHLALSYSALFAVCESATDDLGLLNLATALVPRNLLTLFVAHLGGAPLSSPGVQQTAYAMGTSLLVWARSPSQSGETEADVKEVYSCTRRRSSLRDSPPGYSLASPASSATSLPNPSQSSSKSTFALPRLPFPVLLPFLPFLPVLLQAIHPFSALPALPLDRLPDYYKNRIGLHHRASHPFVPPTLDIVFSYFNESPLEFEEHVKHVLNLGMTQRYRTRVSVYSKGGGDVAALERIEGVDEVIQLPNKGREGGTYLTHILRRFAPPAPDDPFGAGHETEHADLTLFLQHHLAWSWIADQRFDFVDDRSGFLALGPWVKNDCGEDLKGTGRYERMKDIYVMALSRRRALPSPLVPQSSRSWLIVRLSPTLPYAQFCPPTLQLSSWAAQFFVSRQRIVANPPSKYQRLRELLEAPEEHWIYTEGAHFSWHGAMGPTNPYLGHALERSWPVIFNCTDPNIASRCPDDRYDKEACQCFDR
ncbi:hypothetical protein JCM5296_003676 [Sporobolomyces johnsonii]